MKRAIFFLLLFVILCQFASAQRRGHSGIEFKHDGGISAPYAMMEDYAFTGGGLTYFPRVNLMVINEDVACSFGAHLTAGVIFDVEAPDSYDSQTAFMYEAPIHLDFNFGTRATDQNRETFGGFFGLGYAISSIENPNLEDEAISNNASGGYLHGGLRFGESPNAFSLEVYTILGQNNVNVYGVRMLLGIGLFQQ